MKKTVIPNEPVIVVKDSERVILSNNATANARQSADAGSQFHAGGFSFKFLSSTFEQPNTPRPDAADSRYSYHADYDFEINTWSFYYNLQHHRDYAYYGIAPELGVNTGVFSNDRAEYITAIRLQAPMNLQNIFDDVMTDWSDGNLEFQVSVLFVDGQTALGNLNKVFGLSLGDLCNYTVNPNGSITINSVHEYVFYRPWIDPYYKGVEILPWDMQRYGDTWKFAVQEQDATTTTSYTINSSITSNFGSNYSGGQKDGPNFGSTSSSGVSYSQTYQLTVAGQSDFLGEALLHWTDPVVTDLDWSDESWVQGHTYEISTGTVRLSIEPLYRWHL